MQIAILLVSRGADLHLKTSLGNTALDLCKTDEDRNILIDACSPFISSNISIPSDKVDADKNEKIVFLPTNLTDHQKIQLQKCAQLLKANIVDEFNHNVTHIITSCDSMGNCTRTMKVLMGILSGKWIINSQWIDVCLEYKQKVDEEVFEVQGTKNQPNTQGPKFGRENIKQKLLPLFYGFFFYLHGQFTKPTPERDDLCSLIHVGGGKVLAREPRPETVSSKPHMIPYHAANTSMEDISHIILYQEKPPRDSHVHSSYIC
ncbi:BRCA1-associated RING domain protein 1, partial [Stegodyphus mimosarum]